MRNHLRFLLLFSVFGCALFFSCGALAAAIPSIDFSSHDLRSTNLITDSTGNSGDRTAYHSFDETREGDIVTGPPPHHFYPLVADFGAMGALWSYSPTSGWMQLATASPNLMLESGGRLVANFPGHGLYRYDGSMIWTLLTPNSSVENLLWIDEWLCADFGSLGLWKYDGEWHNLSYWNPNKMLAYNGYGGVNLVANFLGYGLYEYEQASAESTEFTWTQLTPNDTVQALIQVDSHIFYADYGTLGLWKYDDHLKYDDYQWEPWEQVTTADANLLESGPGGLVANFPGHGLWQYDGTTWIQLTPNDTVQTLIQIGKGMYGSRHLYADYGKLGLWKYDGSWARITFADANLLGFYGLDGNNLVANFPGYGGLYQYSEYYSDWAPLTSNDGVTNMMQVYSLP